MNIKFEIFALVLTSVLMLQDASAFVMYIRMDHATEYTTWKQVAKCFHLWDLDIRGVHNAMWRFFLKGKPVLVVGVPASPYAQYMPASVTPIYLQPSKGS